MSTTFVCYITVKHILLSLQEYLMNLVDKVSCMSPEKFMKIHQEVFELHYNV